MKILQNILCVLLFIFSFPVSAQIEKVIVETYYISDSSDATDTTGGGLPIGSKTYRIYIDLKPRSKLKKIYGDSNHPLIISSDSIFFNNRDRGQSFGNDFSKTWLADNTVAVDSWLTLGQTSKNIGANAYFGILKSQDKDSSFVGGGYNDGGSAGITGLLVNNNSLAGIPITIADGFTIDTAANSWASYGIKDVISNDDSTIFGSIVKSNHFISYNVGLQNSGVGGVIPDSNQVLVAQLTTAGDIEFELNVEVEEPNGITTKIVKYVANSDTLLSGEVLSPFLKYPPICGCTDNRYIQFSPIYGCMITDSCKTLKQYGCTDPLACNYDPAANILLPNFCCYPGSCQNRNISIVCPTLSIDESKDFPLVTIFPNPVSDWLEIQIQFQIAVDAKYEVVDLLGKKIVEKEINSVSVINDHLDMSNLASGIYQLRVITESNFVTKKFIKK